MIARILTALALACSTALPLSAGDSFVVPVTGELLSGWQQADGTRVAAVRLTLAPGWKTYWRSPGDAGIPPHFDWSESDNLRGVGITWPTPEVFLTAGMRTIGYSGDVILPIALAPHHADDPISLRATISLGVCSDICVPHQMALETVLQGDSAKPVPMIAAALAERPYSAKDAGAKAVTCALSPMDDGLRIKARILVPHAGGAEVVIIEPGQPGLWASETDVTRDGGTLIATGEIMAGDGATLSLDRSEIRITVLGKKHAVDIKGCAPG